MTDSEELLRRYLETDALHSQEEARYSKVWPAGQERLEVEVLTPEVLVELTKLGEDAKTARRTWLDSYRSS